MQEEQLQTLEEGISTRIDLENFMQIERFSIQLESPVEDDLVSIPESIRGKALKPLNKNSF